MPLLEQELLTLPEHLSFLLSFGNWIVCHCSIYGLIIHFVSSNTSQHNCKKTETPTQGTSNKYSTPTNSVIPTNMQHRVSFNHFVMDLSFISPAPFPLWVENNYTSHDQNRKKGDNFELVGINFWNARMNQLGRFHVHQHVFLGSGGFRLPFAYYPTRKLSASEIFLTYSNIWLYCQIRSYGWIPSE